MSRGRVVVVGGGVFGATAALELQRRGYGVVLLSARAADPLAASTDISKLVRMDYGSDDDYTELAIESLAIWREWNRTFGTTLFHETGVLFLTAAPLEERPFELESFLRAERHGLAPERLGGAAIAERFPAFRGGRLVDGYLNRAGGWAQSGKAVARLIALARERGVDVRAPEGDVPAGREGATFARLLERGSRVAGVVTSDGAELEADIVLVAAGAWTPHLLPFLSPVLRSVGMPVWWLRPMDASAFVPPHLPGFGADIASTGYYGFPLHPEEGVVKIGYHGTGREMHPESPARTVTPEETGALRAFLAGTMPALSSAPIVHTRICLYCDTPDGHFFIDHAPEREGLVVAAGDSGHGFKFAPVLGRVIADVVERKPNRYAKKFRWRLLGQDVRHEEEARCKPRASGDGFEP